MQQTIVVGMSGGVDSSVTAWLLKQAGYRVIGLFMKNWEQTNPCPVEQDYEDVACVCSQLGIPFYSVNFAKEYWENVFSHSLKQYEKGLTPNPDVLCNQEIKFKCFFHKAIQLGADFIATGHYANKRQLAGSWVLTKGKDPNKDQSYFLYTLTSEVLEKTLFPLGEFQKSDVRKWAREAGLATANKRDSTGICFIGKQNFKNFLSQFIPKHVGNFERLSGEVVGQHDGVAFYTHGQRKGLHIGGEGQAWYVVGKDIERNVVLVEQGENHPALYQTKAEINSLNWVSTPPKRFPLFCSAKVRYRTSESPCSLLNNHQVLFKQPQKAITPGQSIVFYQEDICLGGAIISNSS